MLIALWVINGLLALAFVFAGITKALQPKEKLVASGMGWVEDFSAPTVKLIGAAEFLGAIGLILPLLLNLAPILSPVAAAALAALMLGAVVFHLRKKDGGVMPSLALGLLSSASSVIGFLVTAS